jgi:hypothetical protein
MIWGIGVVLILVGTLMVVYAMQGSPVIAPITTSNLAPQGEGTSGVYHAGEPSFRA